ncbi:hypothetical protein GCM10018793_22680 [Streptomyces sulfonofaciens]|uniref:Uncharacterized protein n=1 Tax=Streptomyces sulfonofaciens TaxID=68272 RepID=A0A919KYT5_9ACTN|nr:hypothetical protein [Streptomyces sulfonofaciens]GHH76601.1 hypothetical protein GCM10018793_22680 [Streptomyces sulfonofaciens]
MTDQEDVRARIEARFTKGFAAVLAVPDRWLPHLGELDRALAQIHPGYQVTQVKEKYGELRFYLPAQLHEAPCCEEWEARHPYPPSPGPARDDFHEALTAHQDTSDHRRQVTQSRERRRKMQHLISLAEEQSAHW